MPRLKQYTMNLWILFTFFNIATLLWYSSSFIEQRIREESGVVNNKSNNLIFIRDAIRMVNLLTEKSRLACETGKEKQLDEFLFALQTEKIRSKLVSNAILIDAKSQEIENIKKANNDLTQIIEMEKKAVVLCFGKEYSGSKKLLDNKSTDYFFSLTKEEELLSREAQRKLGKEIIFSQKLDDAKTGFENALTSFEVSFNHRLNIKIEELKHNREVAMAVNGIISIFIILSIGVIILFMQVQFIRPMQKYTKLLSGENQEEKAPYLDPQGSYELCMLVESLNKSSQKLSESQRLQIEQYKALPIPTFTWQKKGDEFLLINFSDIVRQTLDTKESSLFGKSASHLYGEGSKILNSLQRCFETHEIGELNYSETDKTDGKDYIIKFVFLFPDRVLMHQYDVTKQKQAERMQQQAAMMAEEANRAKSEFLANMSHEIRTPLHAVIGFSEIISKKVQDEKIQGYVEAIHTAGKNLLSLVNNILDLSKFEAGSIKLEIGPVAIKSIFHEVEILFYQRILDKGLKFIVSIDENIPKILMLDEVRLRQILMNLISNAIKFTDRGYIKIHAYLLEKTQENIQNETIGLGIMVEDTGVGIREEDFERIFEAFKQQYHQSEKKYGGTGLGLTICRKFAELMKGKICLESTLYNGSKFTILLDNVEIGRADSRKKEKEILFDKIHFSKGKVLIVDDIESNRTLLHEFLDSVGIKVWVVENGKEMLEACEKENFDLIITDIVMPVMDGLEAVKCLREREKMKGTPVVAFTASPYRLNKQNYKSFGFDAYLVKPATSEELMRVLIQFLPYEKKQGQDKVELETKQELPELKDLEFMEDLNKNVLHYLEKAKGPVRKSNILELAARIIEFGKNYQLESLVKMGENLVLHAERYDVTNIGVSLRYIEDMVFQLQKGGGKGDEHI